MNEQRPSIPGQPHLPQAHPAPHPPLHQVPHPPPLRPGGVPVPAVGRAVVGAMTHIPTDHELEPITLVEDIADASPTSVAPAAPKKIVAMGADLITKKHQWKRQPVKTGTGAVRVKSFHGKYSDQGLEYLDNAINEWLDANADVEVKFVTSTVMTFEGKIREPALVLNVWY